MQDGPEPVQSPSIVILSLQTITSNWVDFDFTVVIPSQYLAESGKVTPFSFDFYRPEEEYPAEAVDDSLDLAN
jgi:hypothetical protein